MRQAEKIAIIRIELDDIEPLIWRRVAVPVATNLKGLHDVIQATMGWLDYHLWKFVGERAYGAPDPDDAGWGKRVQDIRLAKLTAGGIERSNNFKVSAATIARRPLTQYHFNEAGNGD